MFDPNALGEDYKSHAQSLVDGFEQVAQAVNEWSGACSAFSTALNHAADTVQGADSQISDDLAGVSFDGAGDLNMDGV